MALLGLMVALTAEESEVFSMRFATAWVITSDGTKSVPPPLEKLTASPGATKPIRTAVAPARAARSIFKLTEHDPRSISAIAPLGMARYGSVGLPVVMEP